MGIIDRDWYQERWKQRILGSSEHAKPFPGTEPIQPISRHRGGFAAWPLIAVAGCVALAFAFGALVRLLR